MAQHTRRNITGVWIFNLTILEDITVSPGAEGLTQYHIPCQLDPVDFV